uniref:Def-like protein n=1 Tax=Primula vulgaris TaxID=175104 RepID=A5X2R9_9ERIC|nr:Def-like protein [Primula vulgaris]ABD78319.1 Def-like protein [Primula vulgaris]
MARGKIQIKKIENATNRQVTYSKRRNGLFKKAGELAVLCDAKVSIIMLSGTNKIHEFHSPDHVTTKQLFDQYQQTMGIDLWSSHYEKMQEDLRKRKEINKNLRQEIRQRMGDSLSELDLNKLQTLEQDMEKSLEAIRGRKYKVIGNQIETSRKKVRNGEEVHRTLLLEFDAREEDPHYGLVDNGGDYDSVIGYTNEGEPRMLSLRLQPNHHNLASGGGGNGLTTYALL